MALVTCNFFSHALMVHTACHIILPQQGSWESSLPDRRWPTLWLLHGLSDDQTIWLRRTAIERYVEELPLAVVMPAVNRSFYQDMAHGARYWTYLSEELPALLRSWFPLSAQREETFAAGLSMGGYGALRLALTHPDRFAAAISLSGAVMPTATIGADPAWTRELALMFGDLERVPGSDADLFTLAERLTQGEPTTQGAAPRPPIYQYCGRSDFLYNSNVRFHKHLETLGWNSVWVRDAGGHTWDRWDTQIARALEWLIESNLLKRV